MKRLLLVLAGLGLCYSFAPVALVGKAAYSAAATAGSPEVGVLYHVEDTDEIVTSERQTTVVRDRLETLSFGSRMIKAEIIDRITEQGGSLFVFTVPEGLPPGEYGFSPMDSNDTFSFGVGPR